MMRRVLFAAVAAVAACGGDFQRTTGTSGGTGGGGGSFIPGQSYFGRNNWVEYIAGDIPVIVLAPHGGTLRPAEMPDRADPDTVRDMNTLELARAIDSAFARTMGRHPHVIICRVHRVKLDCNRDQATGAGNDPEARQAWAEFHAYIAIAESTVAARSGSGLLIDLHGHGHPAQRLELGYLLSASELGLPDAQLNLRRDSTSIRHLVSFSGRTLVQVLRGTSSFGDLMDARGFPSVPSSSDPSPGNAPYFSGGYNTRTHGSLVSGTISAIQLEANLDGVRDTQANRAAFATAFVEVVRAYLQTHLNLAVP